MPIFGGSGSGGGGITSAIAQPPTSYPGATFTNGFGTITDSRVIAYIQNSNGDFFEDPTINQVGSTIIIDLGTNVTPSGPITIGFYN